MIQNPLISVVVPVYKVESYIDRCIQSLMNQTYENLEIILVDDGSPDRCGEICDTYAQVDARIKVIHKENGGLSDARNVGIDSMQGEYVTFMDSDDNISPYYIENLYRALEETQADMSISCFETVFDNDKPTTIPHPYTEQELELCSPKECMRRILYQNADIEISAWGKLYHRELWKDIRFPKGKLYEDIPVIPKVICNSSSIAVIRNKDYCYYQRKNSIRSNTFSLRKLDAVKHTEDLMKFMITIYPELRLAAECRYFSTVCNILFHMEGEGHPEVRRELWQEILKYRKDMLLDKNGRKKARIGALISYGGYSVMKKVYAGYNKK